MPKQQKPSVDRADVEFAERAAQRSVCDVPKGDLPDDLAKALQRRIEVSLAASTREVVRAGGADDQVRELEAPWRKRRPRDAEPAPQPKPRKAAKKTTAKKPAAKKTAATPAASTENKE